jgi:ABC-2 type transport system permease protein
MMLFGVLYIVFTKVIKVGDGVQHFPAYLLLGIVLWTFFVEATVSGLNAITSRGDLIRKVSIPKYTIVIGTTLSALVNFCLNMVVVLVFMVLSGVPFRSTILLAPFIIVELVIFALACSFILSAVYVKYRDFSHIWDVCLQVLFYAVPIIYPLTLPPIKVAKILSINPLTQILQDARSVMITPTTLTTKEVFGSQWGRFGPVLFVIFVAVLASVYFRSRSKHFAEEL